ncbi:MAG: hypothetical protein OEW90_02005 [Betaproteobacteria bacterium]|nr:hypothetical protein [Betaproteobacteria bacterium]
MAIGSSAHTGELLVNWPQLIFAAGLPVIGGAFIAYNAMIFWPTVGRKEDAPSVAPIFGGVIAAVGIFVASRRELATVLDTASHRLAGFRIFLSHWLSKRAKS